MLSKGCPDCGQNKSLTEFYKNKARYDGVQSVCKACIKKRTKQWYDSNKDFHNAYMRKHSKENRWMYNARDAKRRAAELQATPSWADLEQIGRIYKLCRKVTKKTGVEHHVDHILPLQGENVCGLHVEKNLAILPAKMNLSKGNTYNNVVGSPKQPSATSREK